MEGIRQKDEIRHALSPIPDLKVDDGITPSSFPHESRSRIESHPAEAPARRIMIVDDSRFIRKIVQEIIESDSALSVVGYATNGQDALAKIEEIKPDLILLDWDMPVMKGSTGSHAHHDKDAMPGHYPKQLCRRRWDQPYRLIVPRRSRFPAEASK